MEQVLDICKGPYASNQPVDCTDEQPRHLIAETRLPTPVDSGQMAHVYYECACRG
jgi:hypothetical protein